jgi:CDP-diacylglycerol--serine O-phosphatidyltransferase
MTGRGNKNVRPIRDSGDDGPAMPRGVYILPNLFTTASIFLGFYAILSASQGQFVRAAICIVVAHICDGLDGRIARLTNTTSAFGVQYDSLADLVAFGVSPAVLIYYWALQPFGAWGWLAASLFVVCGALRLARFNAQAAVSKSIDFIGLPIPAAADLLAATVLLYDYFDVPADSSRYVLVPILVYSLALLMVSNVPYYSFKDINVRSRQPFSMLVAAVILVMLIIAEPQIMLFGGMFGYAVSGPAKGILGWLRQDTAIAEDQRKSEDKAARDGTRSD